MKPVDFPEVGYTPANLRLLLKRANITQHRAATMLGVNERTVNSWCAPIDRAQHTDMPTKKWAELQKILGTGLQYEILSRIINPHKQQ